MVADGRYIGVYLKCTCLTILPFIEYLKKKFYKLPYNHSLFNSNTLQMWNCKNVFGHIIKIQIS